MENRKGMVNVTSSYIEIDNFSSMTIIGDPGCDGLGASTMSIFAKALNLKNSKFNIIVGDIVPVGSKQLYKNVTEFIGALSDKPTYSLCGNHDTDFYNEYFGLSNYVIYSNEVAFILLDNSKRIFDAESLELLKKALQKCNSENIVILFHIPPPNSFTKNSVNIEEWNKLRDIYLPSKDRIKYFICGHLHSYFEDKVDDIDLIVTGGGGARIEYVCDRIEKNNIRNHAVKLYFDKDRKLKHKYINLENISYNPELEDEKLKAYLETAFRNEAIAHFRYKLFAELTAERELSGLTKLFSALADSEYHHAKNHFSVLNERKSIREFIEDSIKNENYEINTMYKDYLAYAEEKNHGLAKYSFFDSLEAEKVHKPLLEEYLKLYTEEKNIESKYFTCTSCGYTFNIDNQPKRCPVCGAPQDKIKEVNVKM